MTYFYLHLMICYEIFLIQFKNMFLQIFDWHSFKSKWDIRENYLAEKLLPFTRHEIFAKPFSLIHYYLRVILLENIYCGLNSADCIKKQNSVPRHAKLLFNGSTILKLWKIRLLYFIETFPVPTDIKLKVELCVRFKMK